MNFSVCVFYRLHLVPVSSTRHRSSSDRAFSPICYTDNCLHETACIFRCNGYKKNYCSVFTIKSVCGALIFHDWGDCAWPSKQLSTAVVAQNTLYNYVHKTMRFNCPKLLLFGSHVLESSGICWPTFAVAKVGRSLGLLFMML